MKSLVASQLIEVDHPHAQLRGAGGTHEGSYAINLTPKALNRWATSNPIRRADHADGLVRQLDARVLGTLPLAHRKAPCAGLMLRALAISSPRRVPRR